MTEPNKRHTAWLAKLTAWLEINNIINAGELDSRTSEATQRVRDATEALVRYSADTHTNTFEQFTRLASHIRAINREREQTGDWLSQTVDSLIAAADRENAPHVVAESRKEHVILLHGLSRSYLSMARFDQNLRNRGYSVTNVNYPSRENTIEELVEGSVCKAVEGVSAEIERIHFITHSMGGILARYYLKEHSTDRVGRVVMLSPPNQGSELVDRFMNIPLYKTINGPAGLQLSTDPESLPNRLGAVDFELGVITGTRTLSPILSTMMTGANDGKVTVENTKVDGMRDLLLVPANHTFMMQEPAIIEQAIYFLQHGLFNRTDIV